MKINNVKESNGSTQVLQRWVPSDQEARTQTDKKIYKAALGIFSVGAGFTLILIGQHANFEGSVFLVPIGISLVGAGFLITDFSGSSRGLGLNTERIEDEELANIQETEKETDENLTEKSNIKRVVDDSVIDTEDSLNLKNISSSKRRRSLLNLNKNGGVKS